MALKTAKIITITSVKGGTGKTTTVLKLAHILNEKNIKTLIMDFDFYSGAVALSLNLKHNKDVYTLVTDMMNNKFENADDYISKLNENIDVLPSPKDPRSASKINANYIELILNRYKTKYDVILIDTNHISSAIKLITLDLSYRFYYLITNTLSDLKNMKSMVAIFKDINEEDYRIVLNNSLGTFKELYNNYDIKTMIGSKIDFKIPKEEYNKDIEKYVSEGKISKPKTTIYNEIVDDFLNN